MNVKHLVCFNCKKRYGPHEHVFRCPDDGGSLQVVYERLPQRKAVKSKEFGLIRPHHWKYSMFYPVGRRNAVTMEEGGTPLLKADGRELYFKYEGENPTGSFKDRGSTIEVTHARELGAQQIMCASTGNMGASVAAYASRAHIPAQIWTPKFAGGAKIEQIKAYGAEVVKYGASYSQSVSKTEELVGMDRYSYLAGDYPYRLEGQKSVAFEIADQLGWEVPDYVVVPVGMGTLAFATFKAFAELKSVGLIKKLPQIVAVQASNVSPVVSAFREGAHSVERVKGDTVAGAINCDLPVYGHEVLHALEKTGGFAVPVSDKQIMDARKRLGAEGLYAEPAGAAAYAGAIKAQLQGRVVCVVTGSGMKDPFAGAVKAERREKAVREHHRRRTHKPKEMRMERILSNSIDNVKREIESMKDPDLKAFLQVEKDNKNRKGMKRWLKKMMEDE